MGIAPDGVAYPFPTYVHLDHAGAAGALADARPNATVLVPEDGAPYATDPERLDAPFESAKRAIAEVAEAYGEPDPVPAERCETLADGDVIDLGDRRLEAVDAPGHAPHQHALLAEDGTLFAGAPPARGRATAVSDQARSGLRSGGGGRHRRAPARPRPGRRAVRALRCPRGVRRRRRRRLEPAVAVGVQSGNSGRRAGRPPLPAD
ncbi:hypothetical protein BRD03_11200 [Halobacteriales archaeon QS_9_68_17]|nr:MAG: hypothetical protein BRD03_11200 [Halobacteriales archaeon QS_9_68_17]